MIPIAVNLEQDIYIDIDTYRYMYGNHSMGCKPFCNVLYNSMLSFYQYKNSIMPHFIHWTFKIHFKKNYSSFTAMHFIPLLSLPAKPSGSLIWRMCYAIQSLPPALCRLVASWRWKKERETRFGDRPATTLVNLMEPETRVVEGIVCTTRC